MDDDQDDSADDASTSEWRYFSDVALDGAQLGRALDLQHLNHNHVRVRVDESPLFGVGRPASSARISLIRSKLNRMVVHGRPTGQENRSLQLF